MEPQAGQQTDWSGHINGHPLEEGCSTPDQHSVSKSVEIPCDNTWTSSSARIRSQRTCSLSAPLYNLFAAAESQQSREGLGFVSLTPSKFGQTWMMARPSQWLKRSFTRTRKKPRMHVLLPALLPCPVPMAGLQAAAEMTLCWDC